MEEFVKHFIRDAQGGWLCVYAAELNLPSGRIQVTPGSRFTPGTTFMGVDLAKLLEARRDRELAPGSAGRRQRGR